MLIKTIKEEEIIKDPTQYKVISDIVGPRSLVGRVLAY